MDPAPFSDNWHLHAIAEHLEAVTYGQIKRLLINIPPRCSKPVSSDALVLCRSKGLLPLASVAVGDEVWTHRARWRPVRAVHRQGVISTVKLTTWSGRTVFAAPDHPFLTPNGWEQVGLLRHEDVVAVVPCYEVCGGNTISREEARLLGYLIGDGCCRGTPNITVGDAVEEADIVRCVIACGFEALPQQYARKDGTKYCRRVSIKGGESRGERSPFVRSGPVRRWLEDRGLWEQSSYSKRVPRQVMEGNNEIVADFLGAYWACDGFVCSRRPKKTDSVRDDLLLGCDSVNRKLLEDIQLLLGRLGVDSRIRKKTAKIKTKRQGDIYTSYTLAVMAQDDCWRFATAITIAHAKYGKIADAYPRRFDFDRPIWGDSVVEVEASGPRDCRCLEVEEDSSFTANGYAVHNSLMLAVSYPCWTWTQPRDPDFPLAGPQVQFLFASYSQVLSERDALKSRRLIASPWYQERWGKNFTIKGDKDTTRKFETSAGGYRLATSVDGTLTGEGADILCIAAGQRVLTPRGQIPIEKMHAGDLALAFCHEQGKVQVDAIIRVESRVRYGCITLRTAGGLSLKCSFDHPIFAAGRGYVPAEDVRIGDGVVRVVGGKSRHQTESPLRVVWQAVFPPFVRGSQGVTTREQTFSMLPEVPGLTSRTQVPSSMPQVWRAAFKSWKALLFQRMPSGYALREAAESGKCSLRGMWRALSHQNFWLSSEILHPKMCGRGALKAYDGRGQFEVYAGSVATSFDTQAKASNSHSGWWSLRRLWGGGQDCNGVEPTPQHSAHASPRRKPSQQCAGESSVSLPCLSQETSSWDFDRIIGIERDSAAKYTAYDLTMARCGNFFVEGILVHNCVDDPINAKQAFYKTIRDAANTWWDEAMSTRLNNQRYGAKIVMMQRLHEEDLAGHIIERARDEDYTTLIIPMEFDGDWRKPTVIGWTDPRTEEGELLWEDRFPRAAIEQLKIDLGPVAAAGQLQQTPSPRGGNIIERDWWQLWPPPAESAEFRGMNCDPDQYPMMSLIVGSVDTAYGEKDEDAYNAMTTWGVWQSARERPQVMLMHAWRKRLPLRGVIPEDAKTDPERRPHWGLVEHVANSVRKLKIDVLLIEDKTRGHDLRAELARLLRPEECQLVMIPANRGGGDKVARLNAVQPMFAAGMVWAPNKAWAEMVISEVASFPKGKTADLVDTTSQVLSYLRRNDILLLGPEADEDNLCRNIFRSQQPAPYDV